MIASTESIARDRASALSSARPRQLASTSPQWRIRSIATLLAVALPLTMLAAGPNVLPGDVTVANAIQGQDWLSGWLLNPIVFTNVLGRAPVAIGLSAILAALFFWRRWYAEGALIASAALAWIGNVALKSLAESPRPTESLLTISEHAGGFGFPSGHVMGTTVLLGALFVVATKRTPMRLLRWFIQGTILTTLLFAGIARVEVGAHWPSDVVGGYLWGTILLLTIVTLQSRLSIVTTTIGSFVSRIITQRRQIPVID